MHIMFITLPRGYTIDPNVSPVAVLDGADLVGYLFQIVKEGEHPEWLATKFEEHVEGVWRLGGRRTFRKQRDAEYAVTHNMTT